MSRSISRVTVVGAGTMGAAIAGHFANAGIPSHLLDVVPSSLTTEEEAAGLSLNDEAVRNRIVRAGFERMLQAKPASLFSPERSGLITLGNVDDDLESAAAQSSWIIEAIVEQPRPKQEMMARLEAVAPPDVIISSNTSGIPIRILSAGRGLDFRRRFLGTHFFNPPRYLRLLELIPGENTDAAILSRIKEFAERRLGKGVVIAKDAPNFVGNRMFSYIVSSLLEFAVAGGYTVEEVDRLTGPLIGRPKTASFRLLDVVGVDVAAMVGENLYSLIPEDEDREILRGPLGSAVLNTLVTNGLLGAKSGQGFYKTVVGEGGKRSFWGLDLGAAAEGRVEYREPTGAGSSRVDAVKGAPLSDRMARLVSPDSPPGADCADDRAADLLWHTFSRTLAYASKRLPETAATPRDIDNAMKWGFGWEMGPFEAWDALGAAETAARMEAEGVQAAPWVREMLAAGRASFYSFEEGGGGEAAVGRRQVYSPEKGEYVAVEDGERVVRVADVRRGRGVLAENDAASLLDLGDGVLLLEFHTKMNALDLGMAAIAGEAVERLHGDATGLVIGNQGANFSAGANLLLIGALAQSGDLDGLDSAIVELQQMVQSLRCAPKPVVAAPYRLALGGGAEVAMCADRIVAHAELYVGQVEVGVGLIPAAGGCKELVRRLVSPHVGRQDADPAPLLQQVFELIALAKVSTSAVEARRMGFLGTADRVVMNYDHLLAEAKAEALRMADDGYVSPEVRGNVYAAGRDHLANLRVGIYMMREAGYISEHEELIADHLAFVLCGGELSQPAWMDEQYFLDLEREAFRTLAGTPKTHARIWHMLKNGKPLRN